MALSAIFIRTAGSALGSFEVVFIRCCFTLLIAVAVNFRKGPEIYKTTQPFMISIRSLILALVVLGNFYAIVHLPLVQVTSIQFTKPLFLVVLAALFLGETVRMYRTTATILGFIGVLLVLRPDGELHIAQIAALVSAISMAVMAVITIKVIHNHSSNSLVFYGNLGVILVCLGPTLYYWVTPSWFDLLMIGGLGLTSYGSQIFMAQAYRYGEATAVTPFEYTRLLFVAIIGYFIYEELPDEWTVTGAILICGSTLFIALREKYKQKQLNKNKTQ